MKVQCKHTSRLENTDIIDLKLEQDWLNDVIAKLIKEVGPLVKEIKTVKNLLSHYKSM